MKRSLLKSHSWVFFTSSKPGHECARLYRRNEKGPLGKKREEVFQARGPCPSGILLCFLFFILVRSHGILGSVAQRKEEPLCLFLSFTFISSLSLSLSFVQLCSCSIFKAIDYKGTGPKDVKVHSCLKPRKGSSKARDWP